MSALIKRNALFPELNTFFDDFFSRDMFDWNSRNYSARGSSFPSVNIKETDHDFQIELAAPGLSKEDFKIELDKQLLTISAEKKTEQEEKEEKYSRREFNYQSFSRTFTLPSNVVESEKTGASYRDGILYISVPKKESAKPQPVKSIAVS